MHLVVINGNKDNAILRQQRASHQQSTIYHGAPVRVETAVAVEVAAKAIALFVHIASRKILFFDGMGKIIVIHKVVTRIIRWVNINHLHFTHIALLQEFEHPKVIALDVEVLGGIPIHRVFGYGAQSVGDRCGSLTAGSLFARPCKLIHFLPILYSIVAQELAQRLKIHNVLEGTRLFVFHFGKARGCYLVECLKVELTTICRCTFQSFRFHYILFFIVLFRKDPRNTEAPHINI